MPVAQPACVGVIHCCTLGEATLSLIQISYHVAVLTAFHLNVGVFVEIVPDGEINVAAGGGPLPTATLNASPVLQGP